MPSLILGEAMPADKKTVFDYLYLDDPRALNALSSAMGGLKGDIDIEALKETERALKLGFSYWVKIDLSGRAGPRSVSRLSGLVMGCRAG
jgi:hypothetical protein